MKSPTSDEKEKDIFISDSTTMKPPMIYSHGAVGAGSGAMSLTSMVTCLLTCLLLQHMS